MTQGTIFACGVAEEYDGCPVHGVVITARCDVAHDKVRVHSYLPVVTLDDWLHRDGRIALAHRLLKEATGRMQAALRDAHYSPTVLETEQPQVVLESLFPSGSDRSLRARFEKGCEHFDLACRSLASAPSHKMCLDVARQAPKLRDGLVSELVHNKLSGFYFLSAIEPHGLDLGYVVLVREIRAVPREVALAIADGLDGAFFDDMCRASPSLRDRLRIRPGEFAYPVGQLLPPHLEHLLQAFAFLFSRIGLPDPDRAYAEGLWARQPTVISAG